MSKTKSRRVSQTRSSQSIPSSSLPPEESGPPLAQGHLQSSNSSNNCNASSRTNSSDSVDNLQEGVVTASVRSDSSAPIAAPAPDAVVSGSVGDTEGKWFAVEAKFVAYDKMSVKNWNDQIDTLLVFAGLFSAVVTAFIIELYPRLQQSPEDVSQVILMHISSQLGDIASSLRNTNRTQKLGVELDGLATVPQFHAPASAVWINTCWFASLVCSLIAASLGMLIKQWLQKYIADDYSEARQRLRVREHRFGGMRHWLVPEIIASLPLLIRVALTLFLLGLIIFLWSLHPVVTWVVGSLIVTWLVTYAISVALPAFFASCPYKSPEAALFYILVRMGIEGSIPTMTRLRYFSWTERERKFREDPDMDVKMLATADLIFADEFLATTIRNCLQDVTTSSVVQFVASTLAQRLHCPSGNVPMYRLAPQLANVTRNAITTLCHVLMDALSREVMHSDAAAVAMKDTAWNMTQDIYQTFTQLAMLFRHGNIDFEEADIVQRLLHLLGLFLLPMKTRALAANLVNIVLSSNSRLLPTQKTVPEPLTAGMLHLIATISGVNVLSFTDYPALPFITSKVRNLKGLTSSQNFLVLCTNIFSLAYKADDTQISQCDFQDLSVALSDALTNSREEIPYHEIQNCAREVASLNDRLNGSLRPLLIQLRQPIRPFYKKRTSNRWRSARRAV